MRASNLHRGEKKSDDSRSSLMCDLARLDRSDDAVSSRHPGRLADVVVSYDEALGLSVPARRR